MNEQRLQAYLNLINALLNCPSGEESEILNANRELVDAGLVETMAKEAEMLSQRGDENAANYLIDVARQLAEALGLSSSSQLDFLLTVLQATADSNGDPQVVYPLLKENLDKIDDKLAVVLEEWATAKLQEVESEIAQSIAADIGNFSNRIQQLPLGNRDSNLEIAITGYNVVLTVYNRQDFPKNWATTQNNLGNAYSDRIIGEKAENIELAIKCYQQALQVRTHEAFPQDWAMTQNNWGNAYSDRIQGEKAENIELAIDCYKQALQVLTREALPQDWAGTQNNLGTAYSDRIKGEKAENIELAIDCYQQALQVLTREALPKNWATTQNNLGTAYSDRIKGKKAENIELAIDCYQQALQVRTREAFTQNNAETLLNLGIAYQEYRQFTAAYNTFVSAIETVELLRGNIVSGDEVKRKHSQEWNQLYLRMVEVCIELHNYTKAIEYADRSKARNLVELIATRDLYPKGEMPEEVRNELQRLKAEINLESRRLANSETRFLQETGFLGEDTIYINELRERYNQLLPFKPIQFNDIEKLIDERTAIIEWYITNDKFLAFIITSDPPLTPPSKGGEQESEPPLLRGAGGIAIWQSTPKDLESLQNWANEYLNDYTQQYPSWLIQLPQRLTQLAEILHIDEILSQIPSNCEKLILIPHRYLHLFPLHALPLKVPPSPGDLEGSEVPPLRGDLGGFLLDRFPNGVSYAPNCQLLQQAQNRQRPNFQHLFAIQNPTADLDYTDLEVATIQQHFDPSDILANTAAKKDAISNALLRNPHCAHFSCHGYFNFASPLQSALLLADSKQPDGDIDLQKCFTLEDIFTSNFSQCRLVTLSACETGLTDFTTNSDEYIGLPSGFLVAGSPSVVSSLWRVTDLSTAFLMIKLYENLQSQTSVPIALNQAQIWLRNVSKKEFIQWTNCLNLGNNWIEEIQAKLEVFNLDDAPFAHPVYWAAFCAIGQ
ncbi:CHAT domain-containing protein [Argonema galeatum]|uniref:CHAT domain-containing protein n=1 Tax=Argonema galeatum TaxID=2942762 RepID=UPI0020137150|nr:CHAT domain-containing protein [Argonema galeatum]MCL1465761.1 CHAT domain-containing protein [Argonema galeatum A003/A1]